MGGLIKLLIVGLIGFAVYHFALKPESEAVIAYKQFANALAERKIDKAILLSDGQIAAELKEYLTIANSKRGIFDHRDLQILVLIGDSLDGFKNNPRYKITKEEKMGPTETIIEAIQASYATTEQGTAGNNVQNRQFVTVTKKGAMWKVTKFREKMQPNKGK